ncbi:hypothetical protein NCS52_00688100 [Fusarium sp. LHS14.1]|nr:hypothetical protein NCS52_00688100 [Fusarium sp. LHS14.1]
MAPSTLGPLLYYRTCTQALGEDTASEASRRSSMNSRRASLGSRTSSVGGATVDEDDDPSEVALGKFLDGLEEIDAYFESFILSSGKTALTKHTKNLSSSSQAFKEAANIQLAGFIGDQRASEMLEYMSIFGEKQLEEAYMAMNRRYNASKKKGKGKGQSKKATTVNEGFVTDVSGRGGDGSQSTTDLNSPQKTRAHPKTPRRPRTRQAIAVDPEDIEEE